MIDWSYTPAGALRRIQHKASVKGGIGWVLANHDDL